MVFDEYQGTEKFWMVLSATAVPQLEAVKGVVNDKDKGTINEEGQSRAVKEFLSQHSSQTRVETDKTSKQTKALTTGAILVNAVELEHH